VATDLFYSLASSRPRKDPSTGPLGGVEAFTRRVLSQSGAPNGNDLRKPMVQAELILPASSDEPFAFQQTMLAKWLESGPAETFVLLGARGSGRTTLAQQLIKQQFDKSVCLYFDGASVSACGALAEQFETTLGMPKFSGTNSHANAKLLPGWIMQVRGNINRRVLLVLDANIDPVGIFLDLNIVLRKSPSPERWKLLVIDATERREQWISIARTPDVGVVLIREVPRLTLQQSLKFVQEAAERACVNAAAALLVTPDAQLLLAHGCKGSMGRMGSVIEHLISQANAQGRRVVSSWDVWNTQFDVNSGNDSESDTVGPNTRPTEWPTKPVLEILNQCRSTCGIQRRR